MALIIDLVIVNLGVAAVGAIAGLILFGFDAQLHDDVGTFLAGAGFWLVVASGYFATFWISVGETPGMRLMGVTVVSVRGGRIGIRQAARRLVGMALCTATLGFGYLPVLFNRRRQGLHDRLARTLVLYEEEVGQQLPGVPERHPAQAPAIPAGGVIGADRVYGGTGLEQRDPKELT